ncbi:uncharacterized protein PAC_19849 [Phialocephala subalpina]|uniref:Uncharacterized protein n=1 Tax=Phialocephala subalpina TaxID=576137 RepID=A0A1L7XY47_9HELO|nr:uncharacterized protein PAC_19849 [Phialocephala subalpina]
MPTLSTAMAPPHTDPTMSEDEDDQLLARTDSALGANKSSQRSKMSSGTASMSTSTTAPKKPSGPFPSAQIQPKAATNPSPTPLPSASASKNPTASANSEASSSTLLTSSNTDKSKPKRKPIPPRPASKAYNTRARFKAREAQKSPRTSPPSSETVTPAKPDYAAIEAANALKADIGAAFRRAGATPAMAHAVQASSVPASSVPAPAPPPTAPFATVTSSKVPSATAASANYSSSPAPSPIVTSTKAPSATAPSAKAPSVLGSSSKGSENRKSDSKPVAQSPKVTEAAKKTNEAVAPAVQKASSKNPSEIDAALDEAIAKTGFSTAVPRELYIPESADMLKEQARQIAEFKAKVAQLEREVKEANTRAASKSKSHQTEVDELQGERDDLLKKNDALKRANKSYKDKDAALEHAFNEAVMGSKKRADLYGGTMAKYFQHAVDVISAKHEANLLLDKKVKELEAAAAKPVVCQDCKDLKPKVLSLKEEIANSQQRLQENLAEAVTHVSKKEDDCRKKIAAEKESRKISLDIANENIKSRQEEIHALHEDINDLTEDRDSYKAAAASSKTALEREKKKTESLEIKNQKLRADIEYQNQQMPASFYQACNAKVRGFGNVAYVIWTFLLLTLQIICMFGFLCYLPFQWLAEELFGWNKPMSPAKLAAKRAAKAEKKTTWLGSLMTWGAGTLKIRPLRSRLTPPLNPTTSSSARSVPSTTQAATVLTCPCDQRHSPLRLHEGSIKSLLDQFPQFPSNDSPDDPGAGNVTLQRGFVKAESTASIDAQWDEPQHWQHNPHSHSNPPTTATTSTALFPLYQLLQDIQIFNLPASSSLNSPELQDAPIRCPDQCDFHAIITHSDAPRIILLGSRSSKQLRDTRVSARETPSGGRTGIIACFSRGLEDLDGESGVVVVVVIVVEFMGVWSLRDVLESVAGGEKCFLKSLWWLGLRLRPKCAAVFMDGVEIELGFRRGLKCAASVYRFYGGSWIHSADMVLLSCIRMRRWRLRG